MYVLITVLGARDIVVKNWRGTCPLGRERENKQIETSIYLRIVIGAKKEMTMLAEKIPDGTNYRVIRPPGHLPWEAFPHQPTHPPPFNQSLFFALQSHLLLLLTWNLSLSLVVSCFCI